MSNSAAASTDPLHEVKTWMQSKKPADIKLAVDAFPKLMVRLWLKEQTAADAAAANSGSTVQTKKPPILFFETARFPLDRNWELLESFRNFKCRFDNAHAYVLVNMLLLAVIIIISFNRCCAVLMNRVQVFSSTK